MDTCQLGIIADDLTGAMDSTGAAASQGLKSIVVLSPTYPILQGHWQVVSYNTQSRLSPKEAAEKAVTDAARQLQEYGVEHLFKKIDSTMRGNIGVELVAMMSASEVSQALVCPTFPAMGRTVKNGILYVDGKELISSSAGNDPFSAVSTSSVVGLLAKQTGQRIGLLELSEVEKGVANIQRQISELSDAHHKILVIDATTQENLRNIAEALAKEKTQSIYVGSAGLASALTERLSKQVERLGQPRKISQQGLTLLISGSLDKATISQLERLQEVPDCQVIGINAASVLTGDSVADNESARVRNEVLIASENNQNIALCWADPNVVEDALRRDDSKSTHSKKLSRLISFTQRITAELVGELPVAALVLIGGETAYTALSGLKAEAVELIGEVQPGIPSGRIIGGIADGKLLVTKAGGFGDDNALAKITTYIRRRQKEV